MFPIRDDIPTHSTPWINYAVIVICGLVFLFQSAANDQGETMVWKYGMIPARITQPQAEIVVKQSDPSNPERVIETTLPPGGPNGWVTIITCMFLHGGLMHIVGNLWFLYIFGDNVEDRYGHLGYALLYLASGIVAGGLHFMSNPLSTVPTIGASGAIAGVLGAYFVMFRHARVMTLLPLGVFTQLVSVPAPLFLGFWFVFQLIAAAGGDSEGGGVAWWAHVGGFIAGAGCTWVLGGGGWVPRQAVVHVPARAWQRHRYPWR